MEYKVKVMISNRHVHLTEEVYNMLFDEKIEKKNDLNQIGQFASVQTLSIGCNDVFIDNVRIVGPFRSYNQVEVSMKDARGLKVFPPVRKSGDLDGALDVTIKTPKGSVTVPALIIANRHIHMNEEKAKELGVTDNQIVKIKIDGDKSGILDVQVKVSKDGYFEVHLDTDDGNAFLLNNGDEVTLIV